MNDSAGGPDLIVRTRSGNDVRRLIRVWTRSVYLATGPPTVSNGGLTYTFPLRKGIRYSTGGVVQPADIRRGIERALLLSGDEFPKLAPLLAAIEGSRACLTGKREHCDLTRGIATSPGSSTVTFHLSKPDPDFLIKLALPDYDAVPA